MGRRHPFTLKEAAGLSRRRKVALLRATYKNSKEYLALARVAHRRRMYGKSYALAALGIEQLGMATLWHRMANGTWDSLPAGFRAHLEGEGKRANAISDHQLKQGAFGFMLLHLFYILAAGLESQYSKAENVVVFNRRFQKRFKIFLRIYADDLRQMQRRKFRGMYVDPGPSRLRSPSEIRANQSTRVIALLAWVVALYRDDVRFPSTPRQSRRLMEAFEASNEAVLRAVEADPTAAVRKHQSAARVAFEAALTRSVVADDSVARNRDQESE